MQSQVKLGFGKGGETDLEIRRKPSIGCMCVIDRLVPKKQLPSVPALCCVHLIPNQIASALRLVPLRGPHVPCLPSWPPTLPSPSLIKINFHFC